ncbi:MAG: lytic murein transglycosylase B [Betaproteobacteria bacterium]|nr:lytic murein transglycosylase B [Betaproteobacteria bacterium]
MKPRLRLLLLLFAVGWASTAFCAGSFAMRPEVQTFITEMREKHGFDDAALELAFASIKPIPAVIRAILPPSDPGIRSWQAYRARFVEARRIRLGLKFWQEHHAALAAAHQNTGVPEEIIVAIIGVETIYGRTTGKFTTLAALATLAFDYPASDLSGAPTPNRSTLFRRELEELLLLARETRRDPLSFKGSYAGALGLPQFLPGSVRRYAVDGDGDGRINLANSPADAISSVANFLKEHGWQRDQPVAVPASVEGEKFSTLLEEGIEPRRNPSELLVYGVTSSDAPELPAALIDLITPQQPTEYRLGYRNFYVLTRYNRSSFYAAAVLDLARELRKRQTTLDTQ